MSRDLLTPRQRLAAYGRGAAIDRLPCVPIVGNTAARVLGVPVGALRRDGQLLAEAQIAAWQRFGYDTVRIFTDLYPLAEALGAEVAVPAEETAYQTAPALRSLADLARLPLVEPEHAASLAPQLDALRRTVAAIGAQVPVSGALTGPFTTAAFLVGVETLGRLMLKEPETAHRLCRLALDNVLRHAAAILATGAGASLTEPMASATVISPRQFATFVQPYLTELIAFLHERGQSVTLHICGKTDKVWEGMVASGADTLSLDNEVDLALARERIGDRVRLMGNIHPSAVLLQGSPAVVRAAVRHCVRQAGTSPKGLIVASGCSLPTETPLANIDAMLEAVRELGWPLKAEA